MPCVGLAFRLTGGKVPVDHGYALYPAISRLLPEIHGAKNIGVHPIRGTREQTVPDTFLQHGKSCRRFAKAERFHTIKSASNAGVDIVDSARAP